VLNVVQSGIMFLGISLGVMACTAGVANGALTVGDTVLFLTLMAQLYGPLSECGARGEGGTRSDGGVRE
jgi:ATP-binding cassette subfamily B (MDR/TAP) protein 6